MLLIFRSLSRKVMFIKAVGFACAPFQQITFVGTLKPLFGYRHKKLTGGHGWFIEQQVAHPKWVFHKRFTAGKKALDVTVAFQSFRFAQSIAPIAHMLTKKNPPCLGQEGRSP